jgi:hypothetical protein
MAKTKLMTYTDPIRAVLAAEDVVRLFSGEGFASVFTLAAAMGAVIDLRISDENKNRPDIRFHKNATIPFTNDEVPDTIGEVYEIKPERNEATAAEEVYEYIVQLGVDYPFIPWRPGQKLGFRQVWPGAFVAPWLAHRKLVAEFRSGGVIVYWFEDYINGTKVEEISAAVSFIVAALTAAALAARTAAQAQFSLQLNVATYNATRGMP